MISHNRMERPDPKKQKLIEFRKSRPADGDGSLAAYFCKTRGSMQWNAEWHSFPRMSYPGLLLPKASFSIKSLRKLSSGIFTKSSSDARGVFYRKDMEFSE